MRRNSGILHRHEVGGPGWGLSEPRIRILSYAAITLSVGFILVLFVLRTLPRLVDASS